MPGLLEPNQVGKRQDLSDYITNVERENFPFLSMVPKDKAPVNTEFETQVDDYGEVDDLGGVPAGQDATNFENQAANRGIIKNKVQKFWENPMVDDFSENVSENPALPGGEYIEAVRKSIVRLKTKIEQRLLSEREAEDNTGGKGYGTCSVFGFLKATAPTGVQVIPTRFRTPSAQIIADTLANTTEEAIQNLMQELYETTNGKGDYTAFVGSELKQKISFMSVYRPSVASHEMVRQFVQKDAQLDVTVDIMSGDFGTVRLVPSTRLRRQTAAGAANTAATRRNSGVILDMTLWGMAWKRKPGHRKLEDAGGGPRGIVDAIIGLRCKNPKGNAVILNSGS